MGKIPPPRYYRAQMGVPICTDYVVDQQDEA